MNEMGRQHQIKTERPPAPGVKNFIIFLIESQNNTLFSQFWNITVEKAQVKAG